MTTVVAGPKPMTLDQAAGALACSMAADGAATGDRFEALWMRLAPETGRLVRRYRHGLAAAGLSDDDAMVELAAHLFRRLPHWRADGGGFAAWWHRVAERHLIDLTRRPTLDAVDLGSVPEPAEETVPPGEQAVERLADEHLGNVWSRYRQCVDHLLNVADDRPRMVVRLLAFQWVELEGVDNRSAAAALGIAEYQCHRYRMWAKRELPRVFRELFPELVDGEQP